MSDQRLFFQSESLEYFKRNYDGRDLRDLPMVPILSDFLESVDLELTGGQILDIGCGPANNLHHLCTRFEAELGVGTEPSVDTVEILGIVYPEYEFYESSSNNLPFGTREFDLVVLRSVLHWVDRDYLLQTIGEALRVCARYLIISDFSPVEAYSTVYEHQPEYRTYKAPYRSLVEQSGFMTPVKVMRHNEGDEWNAIETVLFERQPLHHAFPVRTEDSFRD